MPAFDPDLDQWPHDPDGEKGSDGGRTYGLAVIAKKVDEDEDFPLETSSFVETYGEQPVRLNAERVVSVESIFEHVEPSTIHDKVQFNQAVGTAMRRGGYWEYSPGE